jgi:hypothetical protein
MSGLPLDFISEEKAGEVEWHLKRHVPHVVNLGSAPISAKFRIFLKRTGSCEDFPVYGDLSAPYDAGQKDIHGNGEPPSKTDVFLNIFVIRLDEKKLAVLTLIAALMLTLELAPRLSVFFYLSTVEQSQNIGLL